MRPLRIAFLSPDCVATMNNGTTTYLTRITRALHLVGHEPEIFSVSHLDLGPYDFYGIRVQPVPRYSAGLTRRLGRWANSTNGHLAALVRSLQGAGSLARALDARERERPFDLVHSIDEGLTGLFVRKREGRPLVTFCQYDRGLWTTTEGERHTPASRLLAALIRRSVRRADVAYVHSKFLGDYLLRQYGIRSRVFRPPVFRERVALASAPQGLPGRYLIHFGLLGRRKCTDLVAEALPLAWAQEPDLEMVWAGSMRTDPGAVMARYRQQWGRFANRVTWLGALSKPVLYAVLKRAEAAVLPSRADNLPNTVSESLAFEVPVIAFQGASLDEMVETGVCGELVPDGNVSALANAMLRVWRGERMWIRPPEVFAEMEPRVAAANFLRMAGYDTEALSAATSSLDRSGASQSLRLHSLHPETVRAGGGFNVQPDGRSALSVSCENAGPWTSIVLDGEPRETTYGGSTRLSVLVPAAVTDRPGSHRIHLMDQFLGTSNELELTVEQPL